MPVPWLVLLTASVGLVGGIYGIGGGAIIAPFLVGVWSLPVHTVAGACLLGTFATSVLGVLVFTVLAPLLGSAALSIAPDWRLGLLLGAGGLLGTYCGALVQRFLPQNVIRAVLAAGVLFVALRYLLGFIWR